MDLFRPSPDVEDEGAAIAERDFVGLPRGTLVEVFRGWMGLEKAELRNLGRGDQGVVRSGRAERVSQ